MKVPARVVMLLLVATLGAADESVCTDCDTKDAQALLQAKVTTGQTELPTSETVDDIDMPDSVRMSPFALQPYDDAESGGAESGADGDKPKVSELEVGGTLMGAEDSGQKRAYGLGRRIASMGHRGLAPGAYENSVRSVFMCYLMGCAGFEMDLKMSSDGVAMAVHENALDRISNIRDRDQQWGGPTHRVDRYTATQMKALKMPGTFPPEPISTAEDVFKEAVKYNLFVIIHLKASRNVVVSVGQMIMRIPNVDPSKFIWYGKGQLCWTQYERLADQVSPLFLASAIDDDYTYVPVSATGRNRGWATTTLGKAVDFYILDTAIDIDYALRYKEVGIGRLGGWQNLGSATTLIETNRPDMVECIASTMGDISNEGYLETSGFTCDTVSSSCRPGEQVYARYNGGNWYRATVTALNSYADPPTITVNWHDFDRLNKDVPLTQAISESSTGCPSWPDYRQYIQVQGKNCEGDATNTVTQCPDRYSVTECLVYCQAKCDERKFPSACQFASFSASSKECTLTNTCTMNDEPAVSGNTLMKTATCAPGFRVLAPCPSGTTCRFINAPPWSAAGSGLARNRDSAGRFKDVSTGSAQCGQTCSGRIVAMRMESSRVRVFFDSGRVGEYDFNQVKPCPMSECHGYGPSHPSAYDWGTEADRGSGAFSLGRNNCKLSCAELEIL